ncbi:unnamed protein product [Pleuronectes platessa]|uniref:Uncharacterized protein n=1 Tax=Pleuronectes platessa TaxID=8262 RepID=A0A9N7YRK2_PLEPL|nr:unnamed protein product [Pleuronectes platessa]
MRKMVLSLRNNWSGGAPEGTDLFMSRGRAEHRLPQMDTGKPPAFYFFKRHKIEKPIKETEGNPSATALTVLVLDPAGNTCSPAWCSSLPSRHLTPASSICLRGRSLAAVAPAVSREAGRDFRTSTGRKLHSERFSGGRLPLQPAEPPEKRSFPQSRRSSEKPQRLKNFLADSTVDLGESEKRRSIPARRKRKRKRGKHYE